MKKIIFVVLFMILLLVNVNALEGCFPPESPVCGGSGGNDFDIFIEGCTPDGALCGACARQTVGYCQCNGVDEIVADCRGPLGDGGCASTCDTSSGYYCDMTSGDCISEGLNPENCDDEDGNGWDDCTDEQDEAMCYYESVIGPPVIEDCIACPAPGDHLCTEYLSQQACDFDRCAFGTQGPDSYLCQVEGINDCGCHWNTVEGICEFGFMEYDEGSGGDIFCKLEQTFDIDGSGIIEEDEECDENTNKRTLSTVKICETVPPTTTDLGTKEIDCGRVVSPLSFFSLFSLISTLVIFIIYYCFKKE